MIILADTGILLRLADRADPQHSTVKAAVAVLCGQGHRLGMAHQNASEFWNACTRPTTARNGWGLTVAEADQRLRKIEASFLRLSELRRAYDIWRQLVVAHAVQGKQVHDARLVALMKAHGLTHVLTLNGPDFGRYPGITALHPADVAAGRVTV